jgi:thioredoxin-related protein
VDGIKNEFSDELRIIRVDIQSETADDLRNDYEFSITPTFLLFDGEGNLIWRQTGSLDTDQLRSKLTP